MQAILDAVITTLTAAGLSAFSEYPAGALDRTQGPVICAGVKSTKLISSGAGDYLGESTVEGVSREIYGLRMDAVISLDIYSPDDAENGAAGCGGTAESISAAVSSLPSSIKVRAIVRGETEYDGKTEMFFCPMELHCAALLTREENAESGEFTDFYLRGARVKCQ